MLRLLKKNLKIKKPKGKHLEVITNNKGLNQQLKNYQVKLTDQKMEDHIEKEKALKLLNKNVSNVVIPIGVLLNNILNKFLYQNLKLKKIFPH